MKPFTIYNIVLFLLILTIRQLPAEWMQTNGPEGGFVDAIAICRNTVVASSNRSSIYVSSDYGKSWNLSKNGLDDKSIKYAFLENRNKLFAMTSSGLYYSLNDGENWEKCNLELKKDDWVVCVAADGENVVAGSNEGFFLSENNGVSWKFIEHWYPEMVCLATFDDNIFVAYAEYPGFQVSNDLGLTWHDAASELSGIRDCIVKGDSVFAGTFHGVYLSGDKGETWTAVNEELVDSNICDLLIVGDTIFAATDQRLFYSVNNCRSWSVVRGSGLNDATIYSIAISGNVRFVGTDRGIYRFTSNDSLWSAVNSGLAGADVIALEKIGGAFFAGTNKGIQVTLDNGKKWTAVNNAAMKDSYRVTCLAHNENSIFAGTAYNGLFRSTDNGNTWVASDNGLPDSCIRGLASFGDTIFAGTEHNCLYRSIDNGVSWSSLSSISVNTHTLQLVRSENKLYVCFWNKGIYISDDRGETWKSTGINADLALSVNGNTMLATTWGRYAFSSDGGETWIKYEGQSFSSVVYEPESGIFFAGAFLGGVYRSINNGQEWELMSGGLEEDDVITLAIKGDTLFAGTYDKGVLCRPVAEVTSIRKEKLSGCTHIDKVCVFENKSFGLNVRFSLQSRSAVKLELFSITGKKCVEVNMRAQTPGDHSMWIPNKKLTEGMYVYRFKAGTYQEKALIRIVR